MAIDFKKTQKELYQPKTTPSIVDVPEMTYIMVNGAGDPNTSDSYASALEVLYGLSYAIKMSKKSDNIPPGYYDFVVPPLEGLWWLEGSDATDVDFLHKDKFSWISMIRQPEFVTTEVYEATVATLAAKKPELQLSRARLESFVEGLCAQVMHLGSYDSEPETIAALFAFVEASGYQIDLSETRRHHEIYLGDPRKTAPEKLKTVIRYPIALQSK